jgi:hypothetical protein
VSQDPDNASSVESKSEYAETPEGQQARWQTEITTAEKALEDFRKEGDESIKEYLGEGKTFKKARLNLWFADVQTKAATLSGEPRIRARRRYADAKDDVARVSAEILERLLNTDIERDSDGFRRALGNAKQDWLLTDCGQIRFRYGFTEDEAEEEGEDPVKTGEDVETDHVNWRDLLWSPCRTPEEKRWEAYGADMSRDALHKRFDGPLGADLVSKIPLNTKGKANDPQQEKIEEVFARARVWEIWDKEARKVHWFVAGFSQLLDTQDDPLGLPNFFPGPDPLVSNTTSAKYIPKSTYQLAKSLYEEAHNYTRRIRALVKAIKVVGAYAKGNEGIKRILDDAVENSLVPIDDMNALLGKDGMGNPVWIMPIDPQVAALVQLVQQRNLVRADISEVLGLSDVMRGQQAQRVTATTDRIKARAFSMRSQTDQDRYARFASDAQRIRAHILVTKCDAATLIKRSNIEQAERMPAPQPPPVPQMPGMPPQPPPPPQGDVPNTPLIDQAVALLKSDLSAYRIDVDADSLSMTDYDSVQQEGVQILQATSQFFANAAPLMGNPKIAKFFVELYQASISQFRGAERYESIIDRAVADLEEAASAPPSPPQPNPVEAIKLETAKVKGQAETAKAQAGIQQSQVDAQAHIATTQLDVETKKQEFGMKMAELRARQAAQEVIPNVPVRPGEAV